MTSIWDTNSGEEMLDMPGFVKAPGYVCMTFDFAGKQLALANGSVVVIWKIGSFDELLKMARDIVKTPEAAHPGSRQEPSTGSK